jgi:hypothetical protein
MKIEAVQEQIKLSQRENDAEVARWHKNAQANLDMVLRDGSMGVHSATRTGIPAGGTEECPQLYVRRPVLLVSPSCPWSRLHRPLAFVSAHRDLNNWLERPFR